MSAEDVADLRRLLIRRDRWIELYQLMELDLNGLTAGLGKSVKHLEQAIRIPTAGYIRQDGPVAGFHPDSWVEPTLRLRLTPLEPVTSLDVTGFRPEGTKTGRLSVLIDGKEAAKGQVATGQFSLAVPLRGRQTKSFDLEITFEGPCAAGSAGDERRLAWVLLHLSARHGATVGR